MYSHFIKRLVDIVLSLIALPFVILAIIIMSPIIFIDNPGPVFYNGERRGKNGKKFKMFKFRSMYVNSPNLKNADGSTFNSANDKRVTKVGKIMRKLSIDEIPQLLNVLIGDMSFIGPRPTLAIKPYEELDEIRKARLIVRPGITGYSQAYYRNSIEQSDKFKYDCFYIENLSFLMDCKIILQTIKSVFGHKNIYVSTDSAPATETVPATNSDAETEKV